MKRSIDAARCFSALVIVVSLASCSAPRANVLDARAVRVDRTAAQEFVVWPSVAPGSEHWAQKYGDFSMLGNHAVYNVVRPTLTAYFPDPMKATGAAVIVAPGGGFRFLTIDTEGNDVARWLADHGVTAFVLKYRTQEMPDGTVDFLLAFRKFAGELSQKMEKGKIGPPLSGGAAPAGVMVPDNPMDWPFYAPADGMQAMKIVRANAARWHLASNRIGFIGFSAGAAVTYSVITSAPDAEMPDFAATMYYTLSPQVPIPANAPPLYLAGNSGDPISRGMPATYERWRAAGHDAEIHMYPGEEHGFGKSESGKPSSKWIDTFYRWLEQTSAKNRSFNAP